MPLCEGREHHFSQGLRADCKPFDEVLVIRFTGEVFENYEAFVKTLRRYRQRIWSCKYTGESQLTYEEALTLENAVDCVVSRFPSEHEEEAARIVHHSLKNGDDLATQISGLSDNIDCLLAREWMNAVAYAEPVTGVPGVDCLWRLHEYFREKYDLPSELPEDLAESLRPARTKSLGTDHLDEGSAIPNVQANQLGGANALDNDLLAFNGDYDSNLSDWEDDDYKPSRFATEDLPWRARGRGRGRGRGPGQGRGKGRGRGRGRWGGGAGDDANSPASNDGGLRTGVTPGAGRNIVDSLSSKPQVPIIPTSIDLSQLHESLEDVEKRIQPGSIKHGVFTLLKEAGTSGMSINEIVDTLQERGLKTWEEPRQARNSITSTCGHDSAFARIAPGRFALRCLLPSQKVEITPTANLLAASPDSKEAQQLAAMEAAQADAMRRLAEQKSKARVGRNNFKCPKCHRVTHTEASPLVLCDTCPRAYHLACLPNNVSFKDLPTGDWCCPKCVDATQAALRRVMDLETRKKEALERVANKEKAVEEKLVKRLLSGQGDAETGVGGKGGKGGAASGLGKGRGGGKGLKVSGKVAPTSQGAQGEGGECETEDVQQQAQQQRPHRRAILDDWEVVQEEKDHLERLLIRIQELQEVIARTKPLTTENNEDKKDLVVSKEEEKRIDDDSLAEKALASLKETLEASKHLEKIIEGPPASFPQLVLSSLSPIENNRVEEEKMGGEAMDEMRQVGEAAMKEIITVAEFLALYGESCAIEVEPSAQDLVAAIAWPLDHAHFLASLYRQLLLCCLLALSDSPPPVHAKVERWLRVLDDATWPEILRRYIRTVHIMPHIMKERMRIEDDDDEDEDDDDRDDNGAGVSSDNAKAACQGRDGTDQKANQAQSRGTNDQFCRNNGFDSSSSEVQELVVEPEKVLHMDDRAFAVHGVRLLSWMAWWEVPPAVHIRLLSMLCYDVAQGRTLRDDINERVLEYSKLLLEKSRGMVAFRKQKRSKDDGGGGSEGGGPKKKRKSGTQNASRRNGDKKSTNENDDITEDGDGDEEGARDKEGHTSANKDDDVFNTELKAIEAKYDAKLRRKAFRTEPLGLDRFYRRYWWLRGTPGCIFVEDGTNGNTIGVIAGQHVLDDLLTRLNRRGPRERELYRALQRVYDDVVSSFPLPAPPLALCTEDGVKATSAPVSTDAQLAELAASLNVLNFPRPVPTDGRVRQKDISTLATMSFSSMLGVAKAIIEGLVLDTVDALDVLVGLHLDKDALKAIKREVKGSEGVDQLCVVLIGLEAAYSSSGEGLPRGADADSVKMLMDSVEDASCWNDLLSKAAATLFADNNRDQREGRDTELKEIEVKQDDQHVAAELGMNDNQITTKSNLDGQLTDNNPSQGLDQEPETNGRDSRRESVSMDDDLDDSDAEHAYLREKRMRRPARLWRSGRERAVWIKSVCATARNANLSTAASRHGSAASQVTYCAALLDDRVKKLIKVVHKLAEDAARYEEAAEMARAKAEAARPKEVKEVQPIGPMERPLMIRTGKSKTEDGVKIVLKGMGKGPLPSARSSAPGTEACVSDDIVASCRWGYQCSVCLLAGDLLCCEHPEQCAVSVHPECTGLPFPQGPWICTNHDERRLKGRMRARQSQDQGQGQGQAQNQRGRRRTNDTEDSDATISEGGEFSDGDSDSDATQDFDRHRNKRSRRN